MPDPADECFALEIPLNELVRSYRRSLAEGASVLPLPVPPRALQRVPVLGALAVGAGLLLGLQALAIAGVIVWFVASVVAFVLLPCRQRRARSRTLIVLGPAGPAEWTLTHIDADEARVLGALPGYVILGDVNNTPHLLRRTSHTARAAQRHAAPPAPARIRRCITQRSTEPTP